jgi:hypothetical protein
MKATPEAWKEGARLVVLLMASWLITGALNYFTQVPETETTAVLVLVLRMVDKYLFIGKDYKLTQF